MSFDSRYPWLHRIESAVGLSSEDRRQALAIARRINASTGLSCAYNARTGDLFFYYRSPHGGPFAMPFKSVQKFDSDGIPVECVDPIGSVKKYTDSEIGDYITLAKLGQMDVDEKNEIAERNKKAEEYNHRVMVEQHTDARSPSVKDYADFRDKKRRGVGKVITM